MSTATPRRTERPDSAETRFRARIAELGGRVVGVYVSSNLRVACICPEGHATAVLPNSVQRGQGMCNACARVAAARTRRRASEVAFRQRVDELGGTVIGEYIDTQTPVAVRCAAGHDSSPLPNSVLRGHGLCLPCGRLVGFAARGDRAMRTFQENLAALGATLVEAEWLGATVPHRIRCQHAHETTVMPHNVRRRGTCCVVCAERDPVTAGAAFAERVAEQGARILGAYKGSHIPVLIECAAGHETTVMPSNVQRGAGLCRYCAHRFWDAFYVVVSPALRRVKFGVTSGDPRRRLAAHRTDGYTDVVHVRRDMPDAHQLERHILATLRDAGVPAVHGWEYFDASALAVIVDIVDGWTSSTTLA